MIGQVDIYILILICISLLSVVLMGILLMSKRRSISRSKNRNGIIPAAYKTLLDSIHDPVIILDEKKNVVNANHAAERTILEHIEKIDPTPLMVSDTDFLSKIRATIDFNGAVSIGEGENKRYYDMGVSPILENEQQLESSILVLRDITDLIHTENELRSINLRLKTDLHRASGIQSSLLPRSLPTIDGVSFKWFFQPVEELAGDIFNVFRLNEECLGLYLLDVSGHGVVASLLSIALSRILTPLPDQFSILKQITTNPPGVKITSPAAVAENLNRQFPYNETTQQYFSIFYGIFNIKSFEFSFTSAGNPGFVYVPAEGEGSVISHHAFPIGFVENPEYGEETLKLQYGDRIYIFSDGLVEVSNEEGEDYGTERILEALQDLKGHPLEDGIEILVNEVAAWGGGVSLNDDISLLAMEIDQEGRS